VSASSRYVPNRGDIVWLEFDPQAGHEQAGRRPAVVLSPQAYNDRTGLMVCCPVTSKVKGYPFEVALPPDFAITGVALTDQVRNLDWVARNAKFVARLPEDIIRNVLRMAEKLLE
jgi:mRNA interferase MazF